MDEDGPRDAGADRALRRLSATLAHELRSPLQQMALDLGFIDDSFRALSRVVALARRQSEPDPSLGADAANRATQLAEALRSSDAAYLLEEAPKAVQQARQGLARIEQIVSELRELSPQLARGERLTDLGSLVKGVARLSSAEWERDAELQLRLEDGLPQGLCDPEQTQLSLLQMVYRACDEIKARRIKHGTRSTLTLGGALREDAVELWVEQSGSGHVSAAPVRQSVLVRAHSR